MQNDGNNIYLKKSAGTFETDVEKLPIVKLTNLLPCTENPLRYFYLGLLGIRRTLIKWIPSLGPYIEETPGLWLMNRVRDVVDFRKKQREHEKKRLDLLQLMIDSSAQDEIPVRIDRLFCLYSLKSMIISFSFLYLVRCK